MCIDFYVNTTKMLSKLIYYKNKLSLDGKITLDNIINLKKQTNNKKKSFLDSLYQIQGHKDKTLLFESRFENGNLLAAYNLDENMYQLLLQKDTNTKGYNQWFFFRVSNTFKSNKVNIAIINLMRNRTKYSKGIKIWTYSEKKSKCEGIGWHHPIQETNYSSNGLYMFSKGKRKYYSTLSFDYTFEYDDDYVYFANCIPYTYSDLMKDLANYQKAEITKFPFFHRKTLCSTLGGNDVDYITINNSKSEEMNMPIASKEKESIVLIARQHPSESPGSWVIKGAIEFLMSRCEEANYLRDHFIFKIIPMMNPDGVIEGNTRTSFAGCDLNRRWAHPKEIFHPEIYYAKDMISKLASQRKINCFIDFHGHFGAFNSFFYCNNKPEEDNCCKVFPLITSIGSDVINFEQCTFKMEKSKKKTCRINLYNELQIENIVTLETTNFGFLSGKYENCYLNVNLLEEIGRDVCFGIMNNHYYSIKKMNKTIDYTISEYLEKRIQSVLNEFEITKKKYFTEDKNKRQDDRLEIENANSNNDNIVNSDDEDSESQPSEDNMSLEEIKELIVVTKHKKKRNNKIKLSNLMKLTNMKRYTNTNIGVDSKIAININNVQSPTEINFPQLNQPNSTSFPMMKSLNIPIVQLVNKNNINDGSSAPRRSTGKKLNIPSNKISTIKTFDTSSSSGNQITKDTNILPQPNIVININNINQEGNRTKPIKVDTETQTEEIYFKMHWSYFLGTNSIISSKINLEQINNNKTFNLIVENSNLHDFYIQKFANFKRRKITNQKDNQNIKRNGNGNSNFHYDKFEKNNFQINQNKNLIAEGTIIINKVSGISDENELCTSVKEIKKKIVFATKK